MQQNPARAVIEEVRVGGDCTGNGGRLYRKWAFHKIFALCAGFTSRAMRSLFFQNPPFFNPGSALAFMQSTHILRMTPHLCKAPLLQE